jgi:hypothetical protein
MNTRHLLITGIGLALLAGGCATTPFDSQQARRRFRVSSEPDSDVTVTRPAVELAGVGSPVDVRRKPRPVRHPLPEETQERPVPPETPETPDVPVATAAPAVVPAATDVRFLNPDRPPLSPVPGPHPPVAPQTIQPRTPGGDDVRVPVDAGPSVPNQATQIVHPTPAPPAAPVQPPIAVPAPAAAVPASDRQPAATADTVFPSIPADVAATTVADPDPLDHKFAQKMRDYPADLSAHLDYQMLRFLRDDPVPQLDTISTLPGEDRELLTAVMDGLSNFRSGLRANRNMLLSEKVKPLLDMADRVRSEAELTIPTIAICSRVQGFGVYDPMPTTLRAGIDNPVIIYCEVGNFSSQQDDKGMWQTRLSQEAVLYTDTGYPAWRDKSVMPADLSRNRRHDFFVVKKVTLPKTLSVGRYNLKVSIFDEQVKRIAENSVPIELIAQ